MNKKITILIIGFLILVSIIGWAFIESSKPLPGTKYPDLGRDHVPITEKVEYNSNPPTSGKHNPDWIRAGVYETVKEDAYLIHSLEHGYVIMSYNCDSKTSLIPRVFAHGIEEDLNNPPLATGSAEASESAKLPDAFRTGGCHKLVDQLISIFEKKGKRKLIITPRPNMDAKIALTAWIYLEKFNDFDVGRIEKFIDAHRDKGPEQTME